MQHARIQELEAKLAAQAQQLEQAALRHQQEISTLELAHQKELIGMVCRVLFHHQQLRILTLRNE